MNEAPPERIPLLSLAPAELAARVVSLGGKEFHAKILRGAVLAKGILEFEQMTSLSKRLKMPTRRRDSPPCTREHAGGMRSRSNHKAIGGA